MENKRLIDNGELLIYDVSHSDMLLITDVSASGGVGVDKKISISSLSGLFALPAQLQIDNLSNNLSLTANSITSSLNSITSQIANLVVTDQSLSGRINRLEGGNNRVVVVG
jgi:hypothetical protein